MDRYTDIADGIVSRPQRDFIFAYYDADAAAAIGQEPGYRLVDCNQNLSWPVPREDVGDSIYYRPKIGKPFSEWPVYDPFMVFPTGVFIVACVAQCLAVIVWMTLWRDDQQLAFGVVWSTATIWGTFGFHWFYQTEPVRGSKAALTLMTINAVWSHRLASENAQIEADQERYGQGYQPQPSSFHQKPRPHPFFTYVNHDRSSPDYNPLGLNPIDLGKDRTANPWRYRS